MNAFVDRLICIVILLKINIATGFDANPLGEIALKAVELSQTHRPMAAVICAGAIFRYLLKQPQEFGNCLEAISTGYALGLKARSLLAVKWEEMWDRKLDELRSTLNIIPNTLNQQRLQI